MGAWGHLHYTFVTEVVPAAPTIAGRTGRAGAAVFVWCMSPPVTPENTKENKGICFSIDLIFSHIIQLHSILITHQFIHLISGIVNMVQKNRFCTIILSQWSGKQKGIVLRGWVVAHQVYGFGPDHAPYIHVVTDVDGTADSIARCPDQLQKNVKDNL